MNKTIKLEYPYTATLTESGKLFISERKPKDIPPHTLVELHPESVRLLLKLILMESDDYISIGGDFTSMDGM